MSHRKAFGPQRLMSPTVKAVNVARSIRAHELTLNTATWTRYGLETDIMQQGLVRKALDAAQAADLADYLAGRE